MNRGMVTITYMVVTTMGPGRRVGMEEELKHKKRSFGPPPAHKHIHTRRQSRESWLTIRRFDFLHGRVVVAHYTCPFVEK